MGRRGIAIVRFAALAPSRALAFGVDLGVAGRAMPAQPVMPSPNARRIWIESNTTGVTLSRWDGGGRSGELCKGACGELVDDQGNPVFVEGDRILPSPKILLPRDKRELVLSVRGSLPLFVTGVSLVGPGAVGSGCGTTFLSWYVSDPYALHSDRDLGVALLGAGVAAIGVGLVLAVLGRTRVRVRGVR